MSEHNLPKKEVLKYSEIKRYIIEFWGHCKGGNFDIKYLGVSRQFILLQKLCKITGVVYAHSSTEVMPNNWVCVRSIKITIEIYDG